MAEGLSSSTGKIFACLLRQTNYVLIIDTFSRPIRPLYMYI